MTKWIPVAIGVALLVVSAGCLGAFGGPETIESTFDDGPEGWTVTGDAQSGSAEPTHHASGGAAGGYLSADDDVSGGVWYWNASSQYLGDKSSYYGGTLSVVLKQSRKTSQFDAPDVVLTAGSTQIYASFDAPPGTDWTASDVALTEDGWRHVEGDEPVSEEAFRSVLSTLDELWIRGEYREGADTGGIDDVTLAP